MGTTSFWTLPPPLAESAVKHELTNFTFISLKFHHRSDVDVVPTIWDADSSGSLTFRLLILPFGTGI